MEEDRVMYIAIRNKVTLEDLDRTNLQLDIFNAGLIHSNDLETTFNTMFLYYTRQAIATALITLVDDLLRTADIGQNRLALTADIVKLELEKPHYNNIQNIIADFENYKELTFWGCDGNCDKVRTVEYTDIQFPAVYEQEEEFLELKDFDQNVLDILYYLDYQKTDNPQDIENYVFYPFILSMYQAIDFKAILPLMLSYDGYFAPADGGQGIFERTNLPNSSVDRGVLHRIKGLVYKRQYNGVVFSSWFGLTDTTILTAKEFIDIIKYGNVEFFNKSLKVIVTEPIKIDTQSAIAIQGNGITITFSVDRPITYLFDFENYYSVRFQNLQLIVDNPDNVTESLFNLDKVTYSDICLSSDYNMPVDANKLLTLDGNYILPGMEFKDLPLLTADTTNKKALAVYGSLATDTSKFMTHDTIQTITAKHKINQVNITHTGNFIPLTEWVTPVIFGYIKNLIATYKPEPKLPNFANNLEILDNITNSVMPLYSVHNVELLEGDLIRLHKNPNDSETTIGYVNYRLLSSPSAPKSNYTFRAWMVV